MKDQILSKLTTSGMGLFSAALLSITPSSFAQAPEPPEAPEAPEAPVLIVEEDVVRDADSEDEDRPRRKVRKEIRLHRPDEPAHPGYPGDRMEKDVIIRRFDREVGEEEWRGFKPGVRKGRIHIERRGEPGGLPRKEGEIVVRRGPRHREMRFEWDSSHPGEWNLKHPPVPADRFFHFEQGIRRGAPEGKLGHLEEAIRHLNEAGLDEPARNLERQLEKIRAQKEEEDSGDRREVNLERLRQERNELRAEVRKLKRALEQDREGKKAKRSEDRGEERDERRKD